MKGYVFYLIGLISLNCSQFLLGASEDCLGVGEANFLCGPVSPEDLVQIPESSWVVASGMEDDGYLYFIDTQQQESIAVYPSIQSEHRMDTARFDNCPGPQIEGFRPHGLSLVAGDNGKHNLLVVRHGAREAIEVFEIRETPPDSPMLTWIGCVPVSYTHLTLPTIYSV